MKVADLMTRSTTAVEQYAGIHEIAELLLKTPAFVASGRQ